MTMAQRNLSDDTPRLTHHPARDVSSTELISAESLAGHQLREQLQFLNRLDGDERKQRADLDESRRTSAALLGALITVAEKVSALEVVLSEVHGVVMNQKPHKDWYTVREVAERLKKAEFTVREWCRLGRVNAAKRDCGRGNSQEWIVSHDELVRIGNEGLLPEAGGKYDGRRHDRRQREHDGLPHRRSTTTK
jgi:hypothetical protein